jgi:hypothetical protein
MQEEHLYHLSTLEYQKLVEKRLNTSLYHV